MQANQTGVCQGCGMEYDIEAIRAMAGQSAPAVPTNTRQGQAEIDRDALLTYLDDLRILETLLLTSQNMSCTCMNIFLLQISRFLRH